MNARVREQYARATQARDLTLEPEALSDADVLLAAGYAAQGDAGRAVALTIHRALVTGSPASMHEAVDWCADWIQHRSRKGYGRAERRDLARRVLGWVRDHRCPQCHGTGVIAVEGTGGRLANVCTHCRGSGVVLLRECLPHKHVVIAEQLADELARLTGVVISDMARRLTLRLDLPGGV